MKKGWVIKPLGDVFETVTGNTPSKSNAEYYGRHIPLVKPPELQDCELSDAEDGLSEEGARVARVAPPSSILVSCIGNLGKIGFNTVPVAFNQQINAIIPDRSHAIPEFFFYQVLSCRFRDQLESLASGTTVSIVNKSRFNSIEIVIPPLSEQQRMVGILDEAFGGLATAQAQAAQNLQNARDLFDSHLNAVFTQRGDGWVEKRLSDICEISSSLVDPREKQFLDLPHVGGANIESKTGGLIDIKTAREEGLISGKYAFDDTTVLYSKIRPYLMKVARPSFQGLCSADIYPMSPKAGQVDRDYLFHLMLSKHFTDYANIGSARAGMPKVNREHLFEYRTFLPSVAKQKELVTQFDALATETQRLTQIYEQKLAALAELKKSLLHQAFNGEL